MSSSANADDFTLRRFAKKCKHPRFRVRLVRSETGKWNNLTEVLSDARVCQNKAKRAKPLVPGCLVENVTPGGVFDQLHIKNGDYIIGTPKGVILSITDLLEAIDSIAKKSSGCIIVNRDEWELAIAYSAVRGKTRP